MKWLVEYGAILDMSMQAGPAIIEGLLKTSCGAAVLKKLINENAIRGYTGCRMLTLPSLNRILSGEVGPEVIRLCHDAGFKFKEIPELDISWMPDNIQKVFKSVQGVSTLKSLCRLTIRHNIGSPLLKLIGSLGLPELINDYLMFTNECVVSRGQLEELFGDIDCLDDEDL